MRGVRSTFPSLALVAAALVFAGCNGGDAANNASTPTNTATNNGATNASNNAADNNAANNAANNSTDLNEAANNAANNSADEHAGHDHGPGEHGTPSSASAGDKVGIETTKPGTGTGAKDGDHLSMRYTGRLTSGKQFDSNVGKAPFSLVLGQGGVIRGWEEGLQGVKVGEKRTLKIPASKGYGAQGAGEDIPPNADLVFDIECLHIVPAGKSDVVQREAIKAGTGATVKDKQTVTFHFRSLLVDGTKVDSSYDAKKPQTVKLGSGTLQPIGLEAAMVGMKAGGKYRLIFPPAVAFGPAGTPDGKIPSNAVVVFEIEPLSVK